MDYSASQLTSLRREISNLRDLNVLYSQRAKHSPVEEAAADVRSDPKIWWDKARNPMRAA